MCTGKSGLSCTQRRRLGLCGNSIDQPNRLIALEQLELVAGPAGERESAFQADFSDRGTLSEDWAIRTASFDPDDRRL
jgi:hypothetical protein